LCSLQTETGDRTRTNSQLRTAVLKYLLTLSQVANTVRTLTESNVRGDRAAPCVPARAAPRVRARAAARAAPQVSLSRAAPLSNRLLIDGRALATSCRRCARRHRLRLRAEARGGRARLLCGWWARRLCLLEPPLVQLALCMRVRCRLAWGSKRHACADAKGAARADAE